MQSAAPLVWAGAHTCAAVAHAGPNCVRAQALTGICEHRGPSVLVVVGASGHGKSTVMATASRRLQALQQRQETEGEGVAAAVTTTVITHCCGASAAAADVRAMVRRVALNTAKAMGWRLRELEKMEAADGMLPWVMARWEQTRDERAEGSRLVILLDALNELRDEPYRSGAGDTPAQESSPHELRWLPKALPDGVSVVISTLPAGEEQAASVVAPPPEGEAPAAQPEPAHEAAVQEAAAAAAAGGSHAAADGAVLRALRARGGCEELAVGPLGEAERKAVVQQHMALNSKSIQGEEDNYGPLWTNSKCGNVMFLRVAVEELIASAVWNTFATRVKELVACPDTVALIVLQLRRIETLHASVYEDEPEGQPEPEPEGEPELQPEPALTPQDEAAEEEEDMPAEDNCVRLVMGWLWASRDGLSEEELLDLLSTADSTRTAAAEARRGGDGAQERKQKQKQKRKQKHEQKQRRVSPAKWQHLRFALQRLLTECGPLLSLAHSSVRRAVCERYVGTWLAAPGEGPDQADRDSALLPYGNALCVPRQRLLLPRLLRERPELALLQSEMPELLPRLRKHLCALTRRNRAVQRERALHNALADKFVGRGMRATQMAVRLRSSREGDYHLLYAGRTPTVAVVVRVRPFSDRELLAALEELRPTLVVHGRECTLRRPRSSPVKRVFDACLNSCHNRAALRENEPWEPMATQRDVFAQVGEGLVSHVLERGSNGLLLAYGQTGGGKTFTMCRAGAPLCLCAHVNHAPGDSTRRAPTHVRRRAQVRQAERWSGAGAGAALRGRDRAPAGQPLRVRGGLQLHAGGEPQRLVQHPCPLRSLARVCCTSPLAQRCSIPWNFLKNTWNAAACWHISWK